MAADAMIARQELFTALGAIPSAILTLLSAPEFVAAVVDQETTPVAIGFNPFYSYAN
jgi:uncharacterized membrane protein